MASIPPNQTIYFRNLNDKIQKDILKQTLYSLCIAYGRILDIVALKTAKMRGQAFIVFGDIAGSTAALRQLNGRHLFGRPMRVEYALSKSDVVAHSDGTFKFGEPRKHLSAEQRKHMLGIGASESGAKRRPSTSGDEANGGAPVTKRRAMSCGSDAMEEEEDDMAIGDSDDEDEDEDEIGPQPPKADGASATSASGEVASHGVDLRPSPTLFVVNLPADISVSMLEGLFKQYMGFREVRPVPGRGDMVFVDYQSADAAAAARSVLDGFKLLPDKPMKVDFSR
ncbi:U2 small nuclear ribonucleoprotein B'' [Coemansia sp. RSA 2673]|uniref:U2 small nuclear ribonucleoprotein B n=1 Tax=Coemansia thaxteri TaxID=2663907 RepID=A0A9W8EL47_9FUNG|nr:U2 small nuclear ribonucleoprotein B'' [Coemansia thaxteri]KAJ2339535.1 U2 small nuclear ribonucleoprotein B'' [Coemansia sp. RSA 2673]KAJ2487026.1 U2 small nuclear ribonucleoprotein B'' [Coemansia sp. RSA 2320]